MIEIRAYAVLQGLECITLEPDTACPRTSLVSSGVEVVVISRQFFVQHLTLDMRKKLLCSVRQQVDLVGAIEQSRSV